MTDVSCQQAPAEAPPRRSAGPARSRRGRPHSRSGFPIVLTADRTLLATYGILLDGMMSASQTSIVPSLIMNCFLARRLASEGGRVLQAPLGLRRIEAALRRAGWGSDEIALASPECLNDVVGPHTRIIGLSSGDPLGVGMNSTTMAGVAGGEIYVGRWFRRLAQQIRRLRRRAPEAKVVMGGAGAWQLVQDDAAREALGIDHVITGYCEGNVGELFEKVMTGDSLPPVLEGVNARVEDIPPLVGPTIMGGVEVSRGCGLGCHFCTLAREPMRHIPIDTILADATTNLAAGVKNIALITEDAFRYGAKGARPTPERLIDMLQRLRSLNGLRMIQTDHTNIISATQLEDVELREILRLMVGDDHPDGLVWLNLGVETASGRLLAANGGRAKMGGCDDEDWHEVCLEQVRRLSALGYFPLVSLVMGLPGETQADVEQTLRWVKALGDLRAAVFPVFHASLAADRPRFGVRDMTPAHWRLFRACYRLNFKWMPGLFWDNQTRGGVSLRRRLLMQMLGRGQVGWWKVLFVWRSGRLFA